MLIISTFIRTIHFRFLISWEKVWAEPQVEVKHIRMFSLQPMLLLPVVVNLLTFPLQVVTWLTRVISGYMIRMACILYGAWTGITYIQETMMRKELGPLNMLVLCIRNQQDAGTVCLGLILVILYWPGRAQCNQVSTLLPSNKLPLFPSYQLHRGILSNFNLYLQASLFGSK